MKKMRVVGRIIAGAAASTLLLAGAFAAPAQADSENGKGNGGGTVKTTKDTGWGGV
jgi:hypothetical protein